MPWNEVDHLLVFGEKVTDAASGHEGVSFPSYAELALRYGISKSRIGQYATRANCLRRRRGNVEASVGAIPMDWCHHALLEALEFTRFRIAKAEAANKALTEALAFYADADTYEQVDILGQCPLTDDQIPYPDGHHGDYGKRAREALARAVESADASLCRGGAL